MLAIASIRTRPSGSPALADHHTHKPREGQRSVVRSEERRPRLHRRVVRAADSSRWRAGTDRRCRSVRRRVVHVDIVMTTVRRSVLTMHPIEVCQPKTRGRPWVPVRESRCTALAEGRSRSSCWLSRSSEGCRARTRSSPRPRSTPGPEPRNWHLLVLGHVFGHSRPFPVDRTKRPITGSAPVGAAR